MYAPGYYRTQVPDASSDLLDLDTYYCMVAPEAVNQSYSLTWFNYNLKHVYPSPFRCLCSKKIKK